MKFFKTKTQMIAVIAVAAFLVIGGTSIAIVRGVQDKKDDGKDEGLLDITTEMFTAPTALENLKYNLSTQEVINAGQTEYGTFMYKIGDGEWNSTTPLGEFGSYVVSWYIDGKDGYKDYGSKEQPLLIPVTIGKGSLTESQFIAPKAVQNLLYTGEEQTLVTAGSVISSDCGTFMYSLDNETWSAELPKAKDVGTYNVSWYIAGTDYYTSYGSEEEPFSLTNSVAKVAITAEMVTAPSAVEELVYTGEAQELVVAGSTSNNWGTFMYSFNKKTWSSDVPEETNAGNYTIYWYVAGNDNYAGYGSEEEPFSLTNSVAKAKITSSMITAPVAETDFGLGYLVVPGSTEAGKIMYSTRLATDPEDYYWDEYTPMFETKGDYIVSWYVEGENNYESYYDDGDKPFDINVSTTKMALSYTYYPQGICYKNNTTDLLGKAGWQDKDDTAPIIMYHYSLDKTNWQTNLAFSVDAGEHVVYWYSETNTRYYGVGSEQNPQSFLTIITDKENIPTIGEDTFLPMGYTTMYTGEPQEICYEGETLYTGMGKFMYSLDGINYSEEIPTVTEIGYYNLYFYLTEGTTYCGLGNADYPFVDGGEILKPYLLWDQMPYEVNAKYTGEPIELVSFGEGPVDVGTYYYKVGDGDYSTEIPTAIEKGTYTVSWYYDGAGIYEDEGSAESPADTFESIIK